MGGKRVRNESSRGCGCTNAVPETKGGEGATEECWVGLQFNTTLATSPEFGLGLG